MKQNWLSPSKINTYLHCGRQYKFRYVDKERCPVNPILLRGIRIHSDIENFYKISRAKTKDEIFIPELSEDLQVFRESEIRRLNSLIDKKTFWPVKQEMRISDKKHLLRGIIDAIYVDDNGDYIMIDYKSGKGPTPQKIKTYRRQLAIYKIILDNAKVLPKPIKKWGIMFVEHDILFMEEPTHKMIQNAIDDINKTRKGIAEKKFEHNVTPLCNWCGYKDRCEMFQ